MGGIDNENLPIWLRDRIWINGLEGCSDKNKLSETLGVGLVVKG